MIDYPLDIGTRKGGNTSLSRRDVDDARPNGEAGLSFTLSGARAPRYRENARCRIDAASTSATAMAIRCGSSTRPTVASAWTDCVIAF